MQRYQLSPNISKNKTRFNLYCLDQLSLSLNLPFGVFISNLHCLTVNNTLIAVTLGPLGYILFGMLWSDDTGRERLIRTRLIRSSTQFEVSFKFWQESYHFMF